MHFKPPGQLDAPWPWSFVYASFLPKSKDMQLCQYGDSKFPVDVNVSPWLTEDQFKVCILFWSWYSVAVCIIPHLPDEVRGFQSTPRSIHSFLVSRCFSCEDKLLFSIANFLSKMNNIAQPFFFLFFLTISHLKVFLALICFFVFLVPWTTFTLGMYLASVCYYSQNNDCNEVYWHEKKNHMKTSWHRCQLLFDSFKDKNKQTNTQTKTDIKLYSHHTINVKHEYETWVLWVKMLQSNI